MIVGIGIDIVEISRVEHLVSDEAVENRFKKRILSQREIQEYDALVSVSPEKSHRFLAKRFAVKESVAKAFGTGFRGGLRYQHIGVEHDSLGKPILVLEGFAERLCQRLEITNHLLTLSDELHYVVAMALFEKGVC